MKSLSDFLTEKKEKDAYDKFFEKKLKKWSVESPDEIPDHKKDDFFDEVDREWKADNE